MSKKVASKPAPSKKESDSDSSSSSEDEVVVTTKQTAAPAKKAAPAPAKPAAKKAESDSDSSSSEDEKPAPKKAAPAPAAKPATPAKKAESDSDSDSEEEEKPVQTNGKRKADEAFSTPAKTESSSSSSSSGPVTLFCGNLSFDIDEPTLRKFFQDGNAELESVRWVEKEGKFKGIGFAILKNSSDTDNALKLNGQDVMGRAIKIEVSTTQSRERTPGAGGAGAKTWEKTPRPEAGTDTLFIGNLSFQITEDNVREFFKDCGEIVGVRWVEKEGQFKGLGFVQFASTDAADAGMKLDGSDLLGRNVRLDYANTASKGGDRGGRGGDRGGRGGGRGGFGGGRGGGRGGFGGGRGGRDNAAAQKRSGSFSPGMEPSNKRMKFNSDE